MFRIQSAKGLAYSKRLDKQKITILVPIIMFIAITISSISSCKDNTIQPKFNETRNPVILSLSVFPKFVKPNDSLIVICNAMDPDADTLVYDWYSLTGAKIKGTWLPALFNTHENSQIFYAPDSLYGSAQQDTFRIECAARDGKGGQVSEHVYFIVKQNSGEDAFNTTLARGAKTPNVH